MYLNRRLLGISLMGLCLLSTAGVYAQTKKKPPVKKPPVKNQTKGQGQMVGANGQFGVIYSLSSHLNFAILSAKYTLEPFISYSQKKATAESKIFVLDIAVKNVQPTDNYLGEPGITLVDSAGQLYNDGEFSLKSLNGKEASFNLRPGQGLGQASLNDPLQIGFVIPNKARIVKIMLNKGRLGKNEEVFRYFVAGAMKEEAGELGDPKNIITSFPESAKDESDKSGAIPLAEGKGVLGEYAPSGAYHLRLDKFEYSTDKVGTGDLEEGKKYAVATVTAKYAQRAEGSMFDVSGGDTPLHEAVDADGERAKPSAFLKAKRNEDADHAFKQGDEYTFRIVFTIPKEAKIKNLVLGSAASPKWAFDVSKL